MSETIDADIATPFIPNAELNENPDKSEKSGGIHSSNSLRRDSYTPDGKRLVKYYATEGTTPGLRSELKANNEIESKTLYSSQSEKFNTNQTPIQDKFMSDDLPMWVESVAEDAPITVNEDLIIEGYSEQSVEGDQEQTSDQQSEEVQEQKASTTEISQEYIEAADKIKNITHVLTEQLPEGYTTGLKELVEGIQRTGNRLAGLVEEQIQPLERKYRRQSEYGEPEEELAIIVRAFRSQYQEGLVENLQTILNNLGENVLSESPRLNELRQTLLELTTTLNNRVADPKNLDKLESPDVPIKQRAEEVQDQREKTAVALEFDQEVQLQSVQSQLSWGNLEENINVLKNRLEYSQYADELYEVSSQIRQLGNMVDELRPVITKILENLNEGKIQLARLPQALEDLITEINKQDTQSETPQQ